MRLSEQYELRAENRAEFVLYRLSHGKTTTFPRIPFPETKRALMFPSA